MTTLVLRFLHMLVLKPRDVQIFGRQPISTGHLLIDLRLCRPAFLQTGG